MEGSMRLRKVGNYGLPLLAVFSLIATAPSLAADRDQAALVAPVSEAYRALVVAAIAERNRQFEQNFAARETGKLIDDYFVPDRLKPVGMGPGKAPVRGKKEILADFLRVGEGPRSMKIRTIEVTVSRDMASEIGRVFLTGPDGTERIGRYTVLWLKTTQGWRAKMDFFASDAWSD